jgi:hypothetical protein
MRQIFTDTFYRENQGGLKVLSASPGINGSFGLFKLVEGFTVVSALHHGSVYKAFALAAYINLDELFFRVIASNAFPLDARVAPLCCDGLEILGHVRLRIL